MTPEQEAKLDRLLAETAGVREEFGRLRTELGGKVERAERTIIAVRSRLEESNRVLSESVVSLRETVREEAGLQFEVLQNMFEQLRADLIGRVDGASAELLARLAELKSDVLHLVKKDSELAERVASAIEMGVQRGQDLAMFADEVRDLRRGIAAVYDRAGVAFKVADDADVASERTGR